MLKSLFSIAMTHRVKLLQIYIRAQVLILDDVTSQTASLPAQLLLLDATSAPKFIDDNSGLSS
jgi:hypothetical protein